MIHPTIASNKYVSTFDSLTVFTVDHFYDVKKDEEYKRLPDVVNPDDILVINTLGGYHSFKDTIYYFDF